LPLSLISHPSIVAMPFAPFRVAGIP